MISEPEPFDYGTISIGGVTEQTFILSNTGGQDASALSITNLASPFNFKGGSFPGSGGSCVDGGNIIGTVGICTIVVEFTPIVTGIQNLQMVIDYNNGAGLTSISKNLQGNGAAPAQLIIDRTEPYTFGTVANGSVHLETFTITNTCLLYTSPSPRDS